MKKIIYLLLVMLAISTHINASQYNVFIGLEGGVSNAEFDVTKRTYKNNEITTYGVRGGIIDNTSRMYLSYQYMDAFKGSSNREGKYQALTANTEAFTNILKVSDTFNLNFFLGAHIGAVNLSVDASFGHSDEYSSIYGLQTGILATFKKPFFLEIGYRYSMSSFSDQGHDLSRLKIAYSAINYRF